MENINTFRERVRMYAEQERGNQAKIVKATKITQSALSRFLSGSDLSGRHVILLYTYFQSQTAPEKVPPQSIEQAHSSTCPAR